MRRMLWRTSCPYALASSSSKTLGMDTCILSRLRKLINEVGMWRTMRFIKSLRAIMTKVWCRLRPTWTSRNGAVTCRKMTTAKWLSISTAQIWHRVTSLPRLLSHRSDIHLTSHRWYHTCPDHTFSTLRHTRWSLNIHSPLCLIPRPLDITSHYSRHRANTFRHRRLCSNRFPSHHHRRSRQYSNSSQFNRLSLHQLQYMLWMSPQLLRTLRFVMHSPLSDQWILHSASSITAHNLLATSSSLGMNSQRPICYNSVLLF